MRREARSRKRFERCFAGNDHFLVAVKRRPASRVDPANGSTGSEDMQKAIWKGAVLAESDDTIVVDGYTYFPRAAVRWEHLKPVEKTSLCPWKGTASYFDVEVGDKRNEGAAWQYANPKPAA